MLVLTRREGETIIIGKGIEIRVVRIKHGVVRIGVEAPPDQKILRGELQDRPQRTDGVKEEH